MGNQNWNFDERTKNQDIAFDGSANELCEGCSVDLIQDGTTLTVTVKGNEGNIWTGSITEYPDNDGVIGNTVKFEDKHVFRCAA